MWQSLESAHGRWTSFTSDVALRIETAYRNSEPVIRFFSGRHRYIIHFSSMIQVRKKMLQKLFTQKYLNVKNKKFVRKVVGDIYYLRKNKIEKLPKSCEKIRTEQDSNLRGQSPLDFESNALTTRPSVPG